MKTIILIAALSFPSIAHGELLGRAELLRTLSGSSDLADSTRRNGINLAKLVENCLDDRNAADQVRSWKMLVYYFHTFGADGAAADELSVVFEPSLLKLVDDETLLRILERIPQEHWESGFPIRILNRFNYPSLSDAERLELKARHPTVHRNLEGRLERHLRRLKPNAPRQPADEAEPQR